MTLPNDSVLVTPGSGATLATQTVGSLEVPVMMRAFGSGHLFGTLPTYFSWNERTAAVAQHLSLFNGVGSGKIIHVVHLSITNLQTANVATSFLDLELRKTTAQSAGTAITPRPADTTNPAVPAQVLIAGGATVTESDLIGSYAIGFEEIGTSDTAQAWTRTAGINLLDRETTYLQKDGEQRLILNEGHGLTLKQVAGAVAGTFGIYVVFVVE